jgi:hypothetical protein
LGIDIVPLLPDRFNWCALAVELNARDCALRGGWDALAHATVTGAALEPLLLEASGGPHGFREFQVAHGTSLAMTRYRRREAEAWDAELALALYEEGLAQSLAKVGEPTHAGSWWGFAMSAPPAKRRKLLKSTKQAQELRELLEVTLRDGTLVLKWIVDNSDRALPWPELGSALDWRHHERLLPSQLLDGVDLAKAAKVFEQLDFPRSLVEQVMKALVDAGLDDLATAVEAKLPPGCVWVCWSKWHDLGVGALLSGAFRFLTLVLHSDRVKGRRVASEPGARLQNVAVETGARLRKVGRDAAAAAFEAEFNSTESDDGSEEACEGRRLAAKLQECASAQ